MKSKKLLNKKKTNFSKYSYELKIILLLVIGIFLILENYDIKETIIKIGLNTISSLRELVLSMMVPLLNSILEIEVSDITGYLIISYALFLIYRRLKFNFISRNLVKSSCPKCDGKIHRVHKITSHRFLEKLLFVKIKNYKCINCGVGFIAAEN